MVAASQMTRNNQGYSLKIAIYLLAFSIGRGSAPKGYPEGAFSTLIASAHPNLESLTEEAPVLEPWGKVGKSQRVSRLVKGLAMAHFLAWTALGKSCKPCGPPLPIFNMKNWCNDR